MDAVLADPSSRHHDQVARPDLLGMGRFAVKPGGHDAACSAVDERLAEEPVVENDAAVHGRDAALVAAVLDSFPDPFENPPGMENPLGKGLVVKRRRKTENICVEDESRALARSERIAVHADDPGQRPAVRIERGRGVVRLHLEHEVELVVEFDDPGVVHEHGQAPVLIAHFRADLFRRALDIAVEQRIDPEGPAVFPVVDQRVEDLVLAVLGPRLSQNLEFHVGYPGAQARLLACGRHVLAPKPAPDRLEFRELKREHPVVADLYELFVAHVEIDFLDMRLALGGHVGYVGGHTPARVPVASVHDFIALDQLVGEQPRGDPLHFFSADPAADRVLPGGVHPDVAPVLQQEPNGLRSGFADIVGHARPEADLYQPVEVFGQPPVDRKALNHRIEQRPRGDRLQLFPGQVALDRVDVHGPDRIHRDMQLLDNAPGRLLPQRIPDALFKTDFNAINHG